MNQCSFRFSENPIEIIWESGIFCGIKMTSSARAGRMTADFDSLRKKQKNADF